MHSGAAGTLIRWLLPLFLAAALLGMHHLPAAGEPAAAPTQHDLLRPVEPEAGPPAGAQSDPAHCCTTAAVLAAEPAHDSPGDHGAGHDLLHLCMAVLTALAGIVLVLFVVARGVTGYTPAAVIPAVPLVWARPPPPLSRRLAALGVLRL